MDHENEVPRDHENEVPRDHENEVTLQPRSTYM